MENGYGSGRLWRLLSPLLFFWIIVFVGRYFAILFVQGRKLAGILQPYMPLTFGEIVEALSEIVPLYEREIEEYTLNYLPQILVFGILLTLIYSIYAFRKDRNEEKEAGPLLEKMPKLGQYFLIVGLVIVASLGLNFILIMAGAAFPNLTYNQVAQATIYSAPFWFQIVGFGLIAPVAEEFVFRGLIFKRFRETRSFVRSMLMSSLIFGVVHSNTVQLIYATALGLLFAYAYERFGTLKAPILLHVVANTLALLMTNLNGFAWFFQSPMRLGATIVFCGFLSSTLFVLLQNTQIETKEMTNEPQKEVEKVE